ncbi:unnamed protein product [Prunus armeniaca]|uniref:Uncharacterized protein n=1 Tax=Prunus armeniaca TaxID=36596 RepID=A0A6J5U0I6_PRUAR|nr:unnamed protein product [Prunus armeniaca]
MAQDLLYRGGFWMEGRIDNYNDMKEIRRMLQQLTERVARIEARTQIGKSSDGERCVNPYLNRVARIDTLSRGSLDGEYEGDSPFHYCASLCESSEEGHGYSHCVFEAEEAKKGSKLFTAQYPSSFHLESQTMQHTHLCFIFSDKEFVDLRDKAWFRATIVTSPTNSASKKRKRALVEYESLVTEDGSQQLKDDNNSKYRVVFENPPDLIEFERERLRLHQDWDAGKWVRPNKQNCDVGCNSLPHNIHISGQFYMVMAAAATSGNYPKSVKLHSSKFVRSRVIASGLYPMFYKPPHAFRLKLSSSSCFFCIPQPLLVNNFKTMTWSIRSSVDSSGLDPSPTNGTTGTTRLIRAIQAIQTKLGGKIRELRRGFLFKVLFFLVGFYCATAYATVIGQTGDWDILSAAFAVVVVEGIGALMYKASLPLLMKTRSLITMFNYWKAGLSMGHDLTAIVGMGRRNGSIGGIAAALGKKKTEEVGATMKFKSTGKKMLLKMGRKGKFSLCHVGEHGLETQISPRNNLP